MYYTFTVLDIDTHQPIQGADVLLICDFPGGGTIPYEGWTDVSGVAQIDTHGFVARQWSVSKEGYFTASGTVSGVTMTVYLEQEVIPPPGKGILDCHAYVVADVAASVEIAGVGTYTTPFTLDLDAGDYLLRASYKGQSLEKTVTIVEGATTRVNFTFTVVPPLNLLLPLLLMGVVLVLSQLK